MVSLILIFGEIAILFFMAAAPFYIPNNSVQVVVYILTNTCYFLCFCNIFSFIDSRDGGREGEREGEKETLMWERMKPTTQAGTPTRNRTINLWLCRTTPNQLSHGQGSVFFYSSHPYGCEVLICISLIIMLSILWYAFSSAYWPFVLLWRDVLPVFCWIICFLVELQDLNVSFDNAVSSVGK